MRHLITSNEGVEQGDVIAPVLFAYGLKPALVAAQREGDRLAAFFGVPRPKLFAYLDDIVICADPVTFLGQTNLSTDGKIIIFLI